MYVLSRFSLGKLVGIFIFAFFVVVPFAVNAEGICTQDAMQCADGSWVGRTGPNCQFVCGGVSETPSAPGGMPGGSYQGSIPPSTSAPATPPSGTYTNYPGTEHPGTYTNYPDTEHPYYGGMTGLCTEDAMQCPDGSWVGRSGPNCQFMCSSVQAAGSATASSGGIWNGFLSLWYPHPASEPADTRGQIVQPVGVFQGNSSMIEDMTPVISVSAGSEFTLKEEEVGVFGKIGSWFSDIFFSFW